MKKLLIYNSILFGLGFFGYGLIEILWRGYTHPSMSLAGALCFCFLALIEQKMKQFKFLYRCLISGVLITLIELIFGLILNVKFSVKVWDYSMYPLNFYGQICPIYTVFWCFLSAPFLIITKIIKHKICRTIILDHHRIS